MGTPTNVGATGGSALDAQQKARVGRIGRFLLNIQEPEVGSRAAAHGYANEEHTQGWALWEEASGMHRPFDYALNAASQAFDEPSDVVARYQELDNFENKWLPLLRTGIRRFIERSRRGQVEAAFFLDLARQPLGPGVVGSVELFLLRFDELGRSGIKGVEPLLASLDHKGLTAGEIRRVAKEVADAKREAKVAPAPAISPEELGEAARQQLEAYDDLVAWFNDVAENLRRELSYHDCVHLGLTVPKGGRKAATANPTQAPAAGGSP